MEKGARRIPTPRPTKSADPALIALVIITAVSALVTQPFWSLGVWDETSRDGLAPPVLHVAANRTVTIDGTPIAGDLVPQIEDTLAGRDRSLVYFEADADTSYGFASHVMHQIRLAGGDPRPR